MVEEVNVRILMIEIEDAILARVIFYAWIFIFGTESFACPKTSTQNNIGIFTKSQWITNDPIGQC